MRLRIRNRRLRVIGVIFCVGLFISGCQQKIERRPETETIIPVKVHPIKRGDFNVTLEYVGDVKANDEVTVYPKVSGKIVEKIKEDGQPVSKGEPFAYIDRDEVGLKFERAPIESPIEGIIGRVYVDIGTNVNMQTPVALVVNMDKVKIGLEIPEKYLPKISLGQEASIFVDAYPSEEFKGTVTKISPVVDLATRTAAIEIVVDNQDHRLKSGMFAKTKLIIETRKNIATILKEAIIGNDPDTYVYVVKDNKAILRKVSLGVRQGPYYEVKQGLEEGDLVVVMGQQKLYENSPVRVEE